VALFVIEYHHNRLNVNCHAHVFGEKMATLDLDENASLYQIRSYEPGRIQVNEQIFTQSLILSPHQLIDNWLPQSVHDLKPDSFKQIPDLKPNIDILLIGTGKQLIFILLELYGDLINHGIGVEIMDTAAACRTYNALSAEGRNVAAALIIR
jgi:uncharacterized protein